MKLVSFNINGIRPRLHQLQAIVEKHDPEVIGLQETKVTDDEFPREAVQELGYEVHIRGQKGHYGVAVMTDYDIRAMDKPSDHCPVWAQFDL